MEFPPPPYGGKVYEAGARVQKRETELRNNSFGRRKKNPWAQHKYMQVLKNYPNRVQKTHRQVPHIFL